MSINLKEILLIIESCLMEWLCMMTGTKGISN